MSFLGERNAITLGVSQHTVLSSGPLLTQLSPSLLLQFAGAQTMDPRITFTRSTTATYYDQSGVLSTAAIDAPRFDYDPATLAPLGLLVEEQRTNLLTYSTDLSTGWTKGSAATWTANAATAPDGTMTALGVDGLSGTGRLNTGTTLYTSTLSATGSTAYTVSVYVRAKSGTVSNVCLRLQETGGNNTVSPGNTVGETWQRISLSITTAAGATAVSVTIGTVTGTADLYIWGAQLEAGAFATSYIPTVASQVTRAADVAVMTGTNFSSWFNATEGTFYLDADMYAAQHGFFRHFLSANTGSGVTSDFIGISNPSNSDNAAARVTTANVTQCSMQASITPDAEFTAAFAYRTNNSAVSYDGATSLTDNSVTLPTGIDQLYIGGVSSAGANAATHIRKIVYYPRRLSNAQLQGITS